MKDKPKARGRITPRKINGNLTTIKPILALISQIDPSMLSNIEVDFGGKPLMWLMGNRRDDEVTAIHIHFIPGIGIDPSDGTIVGFFKPCYKTKNQFKSKNRA